MSQHQHGAEMLPGVDSRECQRPARAGHCSVGVPRALRCDPDLPRRRDELQPAAELTHLWQPRCRIDRYMPRRRYALCIQIPRCDASFEGIQAGHQRHCEEGVRGRQEASRARRVWKGAEDWLLTRVSFRAQLSAPLLCTLRFQHHISTVFICSLLYVYNAAQAVRPGGRRVRCRRKGSDRDPAQSGPPPLQSQALITGLQQRYAGGRG